MDAHVGSVWAEGESERAGMAAPRRGNVAGNWQPEGSYVQGLYSFPFNLDSNALKEAL